MNKKINLFHITSICSAIQITRSLQYIPKYNNQNAGDSGLNAGVIGQALIGQDFSGEGVSLLLQYDGPMVKTPQTFPLALGKIYDDLPWRVIVPHGTTSGLTIVGIKTGSDLQWLESVEDAPFWILGHKNKQAWRNK